MKTTAIIFNLIIAAMILCGCGPTQRQRTIQTALLITNSARDGFAEWDQNHQMALVEKASTPTEAKTALADYRTDRAIIVQAFEAMYRSIALVAILNQDDLSVVGLLEAGNALKQSIEDFIKVRRQ